MLSLEVPGSSVAFRHQSQFKFSLSSEMALNVLQGRILLSLKRLPAEVLFRLSIQVQVTLSIREWPPYSCRNPGCKEWPPFLRLGSLIGLQRVPRLKSHLSSITVQRCICPSENGTRIPTGRMLSFQFGSAGWGCMPRHPVAVQRVRCHPRVALIIPEAGCRSVWKRGAGSRSLSSIHLITVQSAFAIQKSPRIPAGQDVSV
ncbi:hypothetical protein AVEN_74969-1 [Araneus ventricosus]|uniref:Uncharacterized protein n=1 Tax=Araneus ventricosus TaxID=182803 RepID=A0A4Y2MBV2_ARAVE|nr:hypothetical protein AVEN_74969-1 [Araneus ventricosus]